MVLRRVGVLTFGLLRKDLLARLGLSILFHLDTGSRMILLSHTINSD